MALPPPLHSDIERLRMEGRAIQVVEDGARFYIVLVGYCLPDGLYVPSVTDLMVMADYQYPMSRMDMFWTDPPIRRPDGTWPQNADQFEEYAGRRWQRWSWHYPQWDPSRHNIRTHLEVVCDRLARG